jgi:hypothetical protein
MVNPFGWMKPLGNFLKRAVGFVQTYVTDENIQLALGWARVAASKYSDNATRREFVVSILVTRGVPENIARIAVEIAVGLLKKESAQEGV